MGVFSAIFKRPVPRGIVLKEGSDEKYRWYCVDTEGTEDVIGPIQKDRVRTVFTDTVGDGYHSAKPCFKDAVREVSVWVDPARLRWFAEHGDLLHECNVSFSGGRTDFALPTSLQE